MELTILSVIRFSETKKVVSRLLEELKHKAIQAEDIGEACIKLGELQNINFVIIDWYGQSLVITDFIKFIREKTLLSDLPILVIVPEDNQKDMVELIGQSIDGFIIQPFNSYHLQEAIVSAFELAETRKCSLILK